MGYRNFRCRKCEQIVSVYYKFAESISNNTPSGILLNKSQHPHCNSVIQDDEHVLCDLVSVSENPLPETVDIVERIKGK